MTPEQLVEVTNVSKIRAEYWTPLLEASMARFGIDTPARQAGFIAQAAHESTRFSRLVEDMTYKSAERLRIVFPSRFKTLEAAAPYVRNPRKLGDLVYAPRGDKLPESSGGGYDHRGRGLFQITWLYNYQRVGAGLGLDLVATPSLLEEPANAADSAAWWWMDLGLNQFADDYEIDRITRKITGPSMLGKAERAQTFAKGIEAFK